jgi:FkbM family methyltransferase
MEVEIDFLLLIEPMKKFNESLLLCYSNIKNIKIENIAIVSDPTIKSTIFYLHEKMDDNIEQASLNRSHIDKVFNRPEYITPEKSHDIQIIEKEVECSDLNSILNKYNLNNIGILFIDAEGSDDSIIKSIDFDKFKVDKIYYENMHINNDSLELFLRERGYSTIKGTPYSIHNNIAIRKDC